MSACAVTICENETSRRGAGHTADGSDPQIANTIGGLRVSLPSASPSRILMPRELRCYPWQGRPSEYQGEAKVILSERLGAGHDVPWIYVVPTCGTKLCLQEMHLRWFRAQKIAYPANVCVYCGLPGYTKDHLLPVTMTGEAVRQFVAVVPACHECNSAIGARGGHRITERREIAHEHIAKRYRKYLDLKKIWPVQALAELGPNLRKSVESGLQKGEVARQRLDWPYEPDYDRRAFEKSGFEDPIAMELL